MSKGRLASVHSHVTCHTRAPAQPGESHWGQVLGLKRVKLKRWDRGCRGSRQANTARGLLAKYQGHSSPWQGAAWRPEGATWPRTQVGAAVPGGRGGGGLTMNSLRGEGHRQGSSQMEADENQNQTRESEGTRRHRNI